ncbi:MAG: FAD/NAD(P)-binding protein [Nitrospirae bacterium]|nr:FAD/NAD(P)-binding protein [Nitrospirota bacterium]
MSWKGKRGMERSNLLPRPATITDIRELTDKEKLFTIRLNDGGNLQYRPCQFVIFSMLGIGEAPISITSSPVGSGESFELCIRSVGNLTGAVHKLSLNDRIGIRGPFGNGFPMEKIDGKDILIVAGGLGLAPLRSLINYIIHHRWKYGRVTILIGAKRPKDILFKDEVMKWEDDPSIETYIAVDLAETGWTRHVGVITGLFKYVDVDPLNTIAAVVGPPVMYRFVVAELLAKGIFEGNIFMSFERRMRCGIGKCGHCQINGIYLCQNGPVMSYRDARKLQEAL